ncbi:helix-turn-helix domain-containing protein [Streptomyces erythrochromogenes]|uniref:helix-turn-helix domain-containing protein n=1 Tax=Streptomyces erythrochromogenes TaxID=285574 RepID=UPI0038698919|nr:helix-turn-helix domain-containing protein [Streptomyces erythrochromogenes]WSR88301.1 helix-turn-helix domain-containing protein [Streptomyces erythrochromogenes]
MAAKPRPTVRRIELGYELRQLRERADKTLEEVAASGAVKGMYFAKLQRVEKGTQTLRTATELRDLLTYYGVTDEEDVAALLEIQREGASQDWWSPFQSSMPSGMPRFVGIEAAARETWAFHPTLVLGLLQTEGYARRLHELAQPIEETTSESIARNVEVRMRRKDALLREEDPLLLRAVLWEPALRNLIGDPEIMIGQYNELAALAALPNVQIQVLPILPPKFRGHTPTHNFSVLHLQDDLPTSVQVDTPWSSTSVSDKPREVGRFKRTFTSLMSSALPPDETPDFLQLLSREITK